jgi:hypothetical protein
MRLIILLSVSIVFIVFTTSKLKWHPFFSLLAAAFDYGSLSGTMSLEEVVKSVNSGFGNTKGYKLQTMGTLTVGIFASLTVWLMCLIILLLFNFNLKM